jgi:hypothetical protein
VSPLENKGEIIVFDGTNNVALPVGSFGQILSSDETEESGLKWVDLSDFDDLSPLTTKGDLIAFDGTANVAVSIGTDDQILVADSNEESGVKWKNNDSLILNGALSTDLSATGIIINNLQAGEALSFGDVVFMHSDGKLYKTDADDATMIPAIAMVLEDLESQSLGSFLFQGTVRKDSWNWTLGGDKYIFVSTSPGELTQTAPSGVGDQVQIVAYPLTADIIYFSPNLATVEI